MLPSHGCFRYLGEAAPNRSRDVAKSVCANLWLAYSYGVYAGNCVRALRADVRAVPMWRQHACFRPYVMCNFHECHLQPTAEARHRRDRRPWCIGGRGRGSKE